MYIQLILAVLSLAQSSFSHTLPRVDPEVYMNITEIIHYHGYPCINHEVITEDGFILGLQRIPHGRNNKGNNGTRPVVLLQHGLLDSAHTWVINLPSQSLGFILADLGFDVWLANSRGTTYSKKNIHDLPNTNQFWKFSFDEMATYDVPANIKYALKVSNATKLSYIAHSQGSLMGFAKFSEDSKIASLVSSFVALGPVITVKHVGWIPRFAIETIGKFSALFDLLYHGEFFSNSKFERFIADTICTKDILTPLCYDPIFWIAGFDTSNLNKSRLPVIIGHTPAGTSMQNVLHFVQMIKSGNFQKYDYGSEEMNVYYYGTKTPPMYNVSKLNVPLAMFWGGKDILADPEDVKNLIPQVYKTLKYQKFIPYYNHMDYVWGEDANKIIYEDVVNFIRSYL